MLKISILKGLKFLCLKSKGLKIEGLKSKINAALLKYPSATKVVFPSPQFQVFKSKRAKINTPNFRRSKTK